MEEDVRGEVKKCRPQIMLTIPQHPPSQGGTPTSPTARSYYNGPLTPQGEPIALPGGFNIFQAYPHKAGEFVSKHFLSFRDFAANTAKSGLSLGEKVSIWCYSRISTLSRKWFTHIFLSLIMIGYSLLGGFLFQMVEGKAEHEAIIHINTERDHLLLLIRNYFREIENIDLPEDEERWEGKSKAALRQYERVLLEHFKEDTHIMSKGDKPTWDFWSSVFYCGTIFTTIGYGHIAPVTTTGRALTIVYSIFGIPLFLILLADFGKLFTRCIKFVWAFVRRFYYTGTCRKVRRTAPVQQTEENENEMDAEDSADTEEVMKGVQIMYDLAHLRRPSQIPPGEEGGIVPTTVPSPTAEYPPTPALSTFAIDDEFNLPVTVAFIILLIYIFLGAFVFWIWEDWTFFEAFYFVFISMSTIGFGDLVPQNQMYMMASIVYLAFGLALTSMCINVVQEKLSDTFRKASAKIGATIGLKVCDDDGTVSPVSPTHVEIAEVHRQQNTPTPQSL